MEKRCAAAATLAMALAAPAWADAPAGEPQSVEIKGVKNPELKTYKVMLAGLDAFDDLHALAPTARELRFKLRARGGAKDVDLSNLALHISGDNTSIDVPIAADLTFALPRNEAAERDDADLVLNKPKGGYRWQPDIRSEAVPENMRRLGDLRLECEVLIAVGKQEIGFMLKAFINSLLLTTDWCMHEKMKINTYSPRKISKATLLHEGQRIELKITDKGLGYQPPLSNKSYPDDALIELEFAND
jgi:hypothetical protein